MFCHVLWSLRSDQRNHWRMLCVLCMMLVLLHCNDCLDMRRMIYLVCCPHRRGMCQRCMLLRMCVHCRMFDQVGLGRTRWDSRCMIHHSRMCLLHMLCMFRRVRWKRHVNNALQRMLSVLCTRFVLLRFGSIRWGMMCMRPRLCWKNLSGRVLRGMIHVQCMMFDQY